MKSSWTQYNHQVSSDFIYHCKENWLASSCRKLHSAVISPSPIPTLFNLASKSIARALFIAAWFFGLQKLPYLQFAFILHLFQLDQFFSGPFCLQMDRLVLGWSHWVQGYQMVSSVHRLQFLQKFDLHILPFFDYLNFMV